MSNYVKATNFRIKDSLTTGDPNKRIKGAEIDDEFVALSTAISSKADSASPAFTGTPTAPTPLSTDNSTRLATTAFVQLAGVPVGAIIMWGGAIVDIPFNYLLCDGTSGTPDLRDRFVIGAGNTYSIASSGGNKDAVVVSHTHVITDPGHRHAHDIDAIFSGGGGLNGIRPTGTAVSTDGWVSSATTGITVNSAGESGIDKNLPPYYALAFIKRIS